MSPSSSTDIGVETSKNGTPVTIALHRLRPRAEFTVASGLGWNRNTVPGTVLGTSARRVLLSALYLYVAALGTIYHGGQSIIKIMKDAGVKVTVSRDRLIEEGRTKYDEHTSVNEVMVDEWARIESGGGNDITIGR